MRDGEGPEPVDQVPECIQVDPPVKEEVQVAALPVAEMDGHGRAAAEVELPREVGGEGQPGLGGVRGQDAAHAVGQLAHRDASARLRASCLVLASSPRAFAASSQSARESARAPQARPSMSIVRSKRLAM